MKANPLTDSVKITVRKPEREATLAAPSCSANPVEIIGPGYCDWLGGDDLKHGNWYWYFPVGFSPEIVLVQGESAFFATGLTWRIKSMSGKWYGPITPPNDQDQP